MKYLLMYNPNSGKGKFIKKLNKVIKYFKDHNLNLDIYASSKPLDLEKQATKVGSDYDTVIVAGGDGSVNEVLNGLMKLDKRPYLGIIPSGTANDIAGILGISKNIKKTLNIITNNKPVLMDVNKINDRYFLYTTAAGVLTKISYDVDREKVKSFGYIAYVQEGAADLFKNYSMPMKVTHDKGVVEGEYMLAIGLSAKRVGGMRLTKFSNAKLNDGKFEMRLIPYTKTFKLYRLLQFILNRGRKAKQDIALVSSFYEIETNENIIWNTDGERGVNGNVSISVLKEELKVFAHPKAIKEYFRKE